MFRGDAKGGSQLLGQQLRPAEELETKAAHPERRGRLGRLRQGWKWFVRADVEGAEDDGPIPHRGCDRLQQRDLLVLGGQLVRAEKKELAAEQSDAIRAGSGGALSILEVGGVAADLDPTAVPGEGGVRINRQRGRTLQGRNRGRRRLVEARAL